VIQCQFLCGERCAAVLALIPVAGINIPPIQFDLLAREAVITEKSNDLWYGDHESRRRDPVVHFVFVRTLILRSIRPSREVVRNIISSFDRNNFGDIVGQKREGTTSTHNAQGGVHLVENQDFRVKTAYEQSQLNLLWRSRQASSWEVYLDLYGAPINGRRSCGNFYSAQISAEKWRVGDDDDGR